MKVDVTQEDIDKGQRNNKWFCPIACAVGRAQGMTPKVNLWNIQTLHELYRLPNEARQFVDDFDAGRPVQPFTFEAEEAWKGKSNA